jgi:C-terminal processing protease CtpA/Prc
MSYTTGGNTYDSAAHYMNPTHNQFKFDESAHELQLTRTMGGTLGAAAVNGSPQAPSDFSSQANSFFANIIGRHKKKNRDSRGASSVASAPGKDDGAQSKEKSSYDIFSQTAGLYDVFAPAGPIGIVVDTTKDGPAVHSLKPTSPMLGLMNPGDLIVGLDDVDTRGMTAATLTRLMAKKANQKERKITLLAAENYY